MPVTVPLHPQPTELVTENRKEGAAAWEVKLHINPPAQPWVHHSSSAKGQTRGAPHGRPRGLRGHLEGFSVSPVPGTCPCLRVQDSDGSPGKTRTPVRMRARPRCIRRALAQSRLAGSPAPSHHKAAGEGRWRRGASIPPPAPPRGLLPRPPPEPRALPASPCPHLPRQPCRRLRHARLHPGLRKGKAGEGTGRKGEAAPGRSAPWCAGGPAGGCG